MFDTNFDSQKLMYHPCRVAYWLKHGITKGPIYTEMELTSRCNHNCIFCGVSHYVNKESHMIETRIAKDIISSLCSIGSKSIMFSGHGEPLLHHNAIEIIKFAARHMSASVTTNGAALDKTKAHLIDQLEWIRFSVNGYNQKNYALVHGTADDMFDRVISNIKEAVMRKHRLGLKVTIGIQTVLLDQNANGIIELANLLKKIGVDYFSVKPYSQHPLNKYKLNIDYNRYLGYEQELRKFEDESFKIIFRSHSMSRIGRQKRYKKCYGTHFFCFISADCNVWECNVFFDDPRFWTGNILQQRLPDIWTGKPRREVLTYINHKMCIDKCRDVCRLDECNRYLWRLKHPLEHDNFI